MRIICSSRFYTWSAAIGASRYCMVYLEALVLQHTLDGSVLTRGRQLRLEHNTEGAVADDLALRVLHISRLAGNTILHFFTDDLCVNSELAIADNKR